MKKCIVDYENRNVYVFNTKKDKWKLLDIYLNPNWNKFATEVEICKHGNYKITWQYQWMLTLNEFTNHFGFNPQRTVNETIPNDAFFEINPDCVIVWTSKYEKRSI